MKKTQEHFVAYLHLLGVQERIANDFNGEFLNKLSNCYELITYDLKNAMPVLEIEDCSIKIFSDNIIIAIPSGTSAQNALHPIIALNRITTEVMLLQRKFLQENIMMQGGVSWGKLYIDDTFVWGEALIDACYLATNIAEYPRVVVDKNMPKFESHVNNLLINFPSLNKVKKDFDDIFFFDYLNYPSDKSTRTLVKNSLNYITDKIKFEEDKRLLKNFAWHKNYLISCKKEWDKVLYFKKQVNKNPQTSDIENINE